MYEAAKLQNWNRGNTKQVLALRVLGMSAAERHPVSFIRRKFEILIYVLFFSANIPHDPAGQDERDM